MLHGPTRSTNTLYSALQSTGFHKGTVWRDSFAMVEFGTKLRRVLNRGRDVNLDMSDVITLLNKLN
ncbi:hypothetical protein VPNG_03865 [Cytospora leucostoma]|uniref:Uncharacterized protein n=1 Tax=Cytospora leucostoma TaxID=1230097 RepID=A0A423XEG6_9PEZI|nr:hypothetical protein VPNG_03865 [Cytospora leucostoma]